MRRTEELYAAVLGPEVWFEWGSNWHELPPCTERAAPMAGLTAEIGRAWAGQVLELSALAETTGASTFAAASAGR